MEPAAMQTHYYPLIFDTADLQAAKAIILTDEGRGGDTETRWALETPYVLELLQQKIGLTPGMVVLDYGCGVGRMAKAIIDAHGCFVIGIDISPAMRAMAPAYVGSDRFLALSPEQFDTLVHNGLRVHAAIAIWVLQHCLAPADDIARIRRGLVDHGRTFVLNMPQRAIPIVKQPDAAPTFGWISDGQDVDALLRAAFTVEAAGVPDQMRIPNVADVGAFWLALRKPKPPAPSTPGPDLLGTGLVR